MSLPIKLGRPRADEVAFIYDAWLRSYRVSPYAGAIPVDLWFETMKPSLDSILLRSEVTVALAGDDATRRVMGFVVTEQPGVIHYGYVKSAYRKLGVGTQLLESACGLLGVQTGKFTFKTKASKWLERRGWEYDPAPARRASV